MNLNSFTPKAKKSFQKIVVHLPFIVIIVVLIVYLLVVLNIRSLSVAEPTAEDESAALANTKIPKIDPQAISQIQKLEKNSPAIHSLFDKARNNPFNE